MLGDLVKLIVAKGFKKLPKFQKITRSGHTANGSWQNISQNFWLVISALKRYLPQKDVFQGLVTKNF